MDVTKYFTDVSFLHILQKAFRSKYIMSEMCERVKAIRIIDKDVKNLSGIEYFKNLEYLNIAYNKVRELDLSKNINLRELYCYKNDIISLRLPDIHMQVVSIYGNDKLLNVSDNGKSADRVILEESQLAEKRIYKNRQRKYFNKKEDTLTL